MPDRLNIVASESTIRPQDWFRPEVLSLNAYHVPPARDVIKLDAMENPFPWPGDLNDQWLDCLRNAQLNRYPDPVATELAQALRRWLGIGDTTGLMLGNGSDELIQLLIMAAGSGTVMAPEPAFVMYRHLALCCGMQFCGIPLQGDDFSLDIDAMLAAIEREQPRLIFLAYPNNPTGNLFARDDVLAIVKAAPGLVIVDEAYSAFASDSLLDAMDDHANLLVMRTLSKIGLAGLRLGMLAGAHEWISQLDKLRLPYNINSLTQAAAVFALERIADLNAQAATLREERTHLLNSLAQMEAVTVWPSEANFLLFRVERAVDIHAGLLEQGIMIKKLDGAHPMLADCLRVTVGTSSENAKFVAALRQIVTA